MPDHGVGVPGGLLILLVAEAAYKGRVARLALVEGSAGHAHLALARPAAVLLLA